MAKRSPVAQEPLTARALVVSGHNGRQVEVDPHPTCQHCGRRVGDYFGIPWSVRCKACGQQAKRD